MSLNPTQIELLRKLLRRGATSRVVKILERLRPAEIAELFQHASPVEIGVLVDVLFAHGEVARVLVELPEGILEELLERLSDERVVRLLEGCAADDALAFAMLLDEERRDRVLAEVRREARERIEHLLTYDAETAGSLMTGQMITLGVDLSAQAAIETIRGWTNAAEFVSYLYVVDDAKTLVGVVPLRRLIASGPDRPIAEIMVSDPIAVPATADQEEVAALTARYNLLAIPVVDDAFRLLGVITVDDVIDVLREEATEDMYLMQGLSDEDRVYTPVSKSVRKRFPWTVLNLATAFTVVIVIGLFEHALAEAVVLAAFMPVVASIGGNGGNQTLTIVTRAIALGELGFSEGKSAIAKQAMIGLVNGAGVGLLAGLIAWVWKGIPALGAVLFGAMFLNLAVAGLVGAAVPLALKALQLDPALGGGIIVTTITDVCGFMLFLGLATAFLPYLVT